MGKCKHCGADLIPMLLTQVCAAECDLKPQAVGQDSRWAAIQLQSGDTLKVVHCSCPQPRCLGILVRFRQGKVATQQTDCEWVQICWPTMDAYVDALLREQNGQLVNAHRWELAES